ncbi:HAMP domain-containing sensor histidine kinase [Paenibacillus sp. FJAT-27812]|uniref:HAMP domain-containing sensor histidine kinase n=1 Tax=Paenibacillus sp. FJAT-27812 TaxID=1684143 RepID=UPI0006A7A1FC|nr:HAMP domain-containing sensor histidine kinase [Paenibacillus sp. FJAT-27812]
MKIQRRLAFHFTYQLIIYSILIFIAMVLLFLILISKLMNDDLKRNFPTGAISSIVAGSYYESDELKLSAHWKQLIEDREMWLQVIDSKGNAIYTINTPADQPSSYSVTQLLSIQQTGKFGPYLVDSELDQTYSSPLYFLLGYKSPQLEKLTAWYTSYQQNGLVNEQYKDDLLAKLLETDSYLLILDQAGNSVQTIGAKNSAFNIYEPLEVLSMQQSPGDYDTNIAVYQPSASGMTWIMHTPNERGTFTKQPMLKEIIRIFIWVGGSILLLSLAISIWHGYRYGQPLILFSGWFERMGSGLYEEVLTPKDRRKVFRRSGKLRIRYRLYREVIAAFYQMAERLARTEKDRLQLEKTREEWMAGISHDLRTPLSTIQGYGYILESTPTSWSTDELQDMGKMIREKSDYMLDLITDFSHIYQLKQGPLPMERSKIELTELVRRSLLKYVNDATLTEVEFRYEGDELPVVICGNEKWLQRLMDNLISNAVKHNAPGITVTASSGMLNDEAFIRVCDNGKGMDEETIRNLFERYYRGTNTEESSDGSGLGMSISKMIVEAHQGRIEVQSAPHEGTTIHIYFPID